LAGRIDAAQSILATPAATEARRLERAYAECSRAIAIARARLEPGAASIAEVGGGLAIFAGIGSPLTQGLAIGLAGPVTEADLDRIESHLRAGHDAPAQLEIGPFVDPSLPAILATRGYAVHEWQLVWTCDLAPAPAPAPAPGPAPTPDGVEVRRVGAGEVDLFAR